MAMWYPAVSRPCSSTKQTLNFKHFKQVSIFCFLSRHTVHMPLCLNRWGKHQNKQQSAWQAAAIRIKTDCVPIPTSAEGRKRRRKMGKEEDGARVLGNVANPCRSLLLPSASTQPCPHLGSTRLQTKAALIEAVVHVSSANSHSFQMEVKDTIQISAPRTVLALRWGSSFRQKYP